LSAKTRACVVRYLPLPSRSYSYTGFYCVDIGVTMKRADQRLPISVRVQVNARRYVSCSGTQGRLGRDCSLTSLRHQSTGKGFFRPPSLFSNQSRYSYPYPNYNTINSDILFDWCIFELLPNNRLLLLQCPIENVLMFVTFT
jgi:hypothetical protein